jgi:hypothetical protein
LIGIYGGNKKCSEVVGGLLCVKIRTGGIRVSKVDGESKRWISLLVLELLDLVRCETEHLINIFQSVRIAAE